MEIGGVTTACRTCGKNHYRRVKTKEEFWKAIDEDYCPECKNKLKGDDLKMPPRKKAKKLSEAVSEPLNDEQIKTVIDEAKKPKALKLPAHKGLPPLPSVGSLPGLGAVAPAKKAAASSPVDFDPVFSAITKAALDIKKDMSEQQKQNNAMFTQIARDITRIFEELQGIAESPKPEVKSSQASAPVSPDVAAVVEDCHTVIQLFADAGQQVAEEQYRDLIHTAIDRSNASGKIIASSSTKEYEAFAKACYDAFLASV